MTLQIYNSLSKKKEVFQPIHPGKVGLYVCGMTVYDYCHIGHARGMVIFDIVMRYLREKGYTVTYVRNITDIDDKIIDRAKERAISIEALTEQFINYLHEDTQALGILPPDREPKATEYIPQMIQMIQTLVDKGYAYVASNGDVYYRVAKFKNYGQLSHQDLEGLKVGARVGVLDVKQDPLDFVLWKLAKPGEPHWPSPWGEGRPGWHIECSVMSTHCLGNHFDIHGAGFDLQFPHHENEIAQSEAATGEKFVNTWMHVGFVQVNKEKMSKSLGNFFTIREALASYSPEVIRYFMIASHYRSPVNYAQDMLDLAHSSLRRLYTALRGFPDEVSAPEQSDFATRFYAAMDDDFNTPLALSILFELAHECNRLREANNRNAASLAALLKKLGTLLGLLQQPPALVLQGSDDTARQTIERLIEQRNEARQARNWQEADQIRHQLAALGVSLEDTPAGTLWRK
jgi:cysteinyl-tRNA synthetase